jgi:hypothetical protein
MIPVTQDNGNANFPSGYIHLTMHDLKPTHNGHGFMFSPPKSVVSASTLDGNVNLDRATSK